MRRFLSPGWLLGHAVALLLVVACLALAWWQVQRAGEGNVRSYAYALEWPVFAGFVVFVWFREVRRARTEPADGEAEHAEPSTAAADSPRPAPSGAVPSRHDPGDTVTSPSQTGEEDDELAAYNRMLAWLNADPNRRMSDYPG